MLNCSVLRRYGLNKMFFKGILLLFFSILFINVANANNINNNDFELFTLKNDFHSFGKYDGYAFPATKKVDNVTTFHFINSKGELSDFDSGRIWGYSLREVLSYYKIRKQIKIGNNTTYREMYVNSKGEYLFNATFNKIALSKYGYALVQAKKNDNVYLLNLKGEILRKYPSMYEFEFIDNPNYFIKIRYHEENGSNYRLESLVDLDGNESFIDKKYISIMDVSENVVMTKVADVEGHSFVDPLFFTLDGKALYTKTNKAGIFISEPFKKGLAIAKKGNEFAIIRADESFAVSLGKYQNIRRTSDNRFIATRKDYYDVLDENAKLINSFKMSVFGALKSCTDSAYIFDMGGRYYYYDKNLKKISDAGYMKARNFENAYSLAYNNDKVFILKDKSYKPKKEELPSKLIKADKTLKEKNLSDILDAVFYLDSKLYTLKDVSPIYIDKKYKFKSVYSDDGLFVFEDKTDNKNVIMDYKGRIVSNRKYIDLPVSGDILSSYIRDYRLFDKIILDDSAKVKIADNYSDLVYFEDKQVYLAQKKLGNTYKYGLLDKTGKPITDFKYDDKLSYKAGKFVFRMGKNVGLVDYRGRTVLDFKYADIRIANGNFYGVKDGAYYYLIDGQGRRLSNSKYTYMEDFNKNDLCIVSYYDEDYIIDSKGDVVFTVDGLFTNILWVDDLNIVQLKVFGKTRQVNIESAGNKYSYDSYRESNYPNIRIVEKNGKKGLTDDDFNMILPIDYDEIYDFSDGIINLYKGGSKRIYNIYNTRVKKLFKHDKYEISHMNGTDDFVLIKDRSSSLYGVADDKRIIIEPKYRGIVFKASKFYARNEVLEEDTTRMYVYDKNGNYEGEKNYNTAYEYTEGVGYRRNSFVDEKGRIIVQDKFSSESPFINGYMLVGIGFGEDRTYMFVSLDKVKELGGIK